MGATHWKPDELTVLRDLMKNEYHAETESIAAFARRIENLFDGRTASSINSKIMNEFKAVEQKITTAPTVAEPKRVVLPALTEFKPIKSGLGMPVQRQQFAAPKLEPTEVKAAIAGFEKVFDYFKDSLWKPNPDETTGIRNYYTTLNAHGVDAVEWMLEAIDVMKLKDSRKWSIEYYVTILKNWIRLGKNAMPHKELEDLFQLFVQETGKELSMEASKVLMRLQTEVGAARLAFEIAKLGTADESLMLALILQYRLLK